MRTRARPDWAFSCTLQVMSSATALQRLEVSTSPLDPPRAGALLNLCEVPPGDYQLRLSFVAEPSRPHPPARRRCWGAVASRECPQLRIPTAFASLSQLLGADHRRRYGGGRGGAQRRANPDPSYHDTVDRGDARAGRHGHGHAVVYAIDNRIIIEPDGFWCSADASRMS